MRDRSLESMGTQCKPRREPELGLALSGGGFRAAFFHIGVMAQMARWGLLRHVEVISTVSGGSIIGALYFIHVKNLLESKSDTQVQDEDYVKIVQQIEVDFLKAVQRNLRMRTFLKPCQNLRMCLPNYSRSDRMSELYDENFYQPVMNRTNKQRVEMGKLKIWPSDVASDFFPLRDNGSREAKAPILLINATTLNTGHNWRFEAARMGEPPRQRSWDKEIDKNLRLRRPKSYCDITEDLQDIWLGDAVAASACVPGIFHPLAIKNLYQWDKELERCSREGQKKNTKQEKIVVQLVDGGVHDNQGVQALLDQKCKHIIVSDASGQMKDEADSDTRLLPVLKRANEIFMDRVREEQLYRLFEERDKHNRAVVFLHLRKGLEAKAISWNDPSGMPSGKIKIESVAATLEFGVAPEVQDLLSRVRTDLDSFTDVEAYSLMADGYLMSGVEVERMDCFKDLMRTKALADSERWQFLRIRRWLKEPTRHYCKQLDVASSTAFKVFKLRLVSSLLAAAVVSAPVVILFRMFLWEWIEGWLNESTSYWQLLRALGLLVLGFVVDMFFSRGSRIYKFIRLIQKGGRGLWALVGRALIPALLGWIIAGIHLLVFDRMFLSYGKIERLK